MVKAYEARYRYLVEFPSGSDRPTAQVSKNRSPSDPAWLTCVYYRSPLARLSFLERCADEWVY